MGRKVVYCDNNAGCFDDEDGRGGDDGGIRGCSHPLFPIPVFFRIFYYLLSSSFYL